MRWILVAFLDDHFVCCVKRIYFAAWIDLVPIRSPFASILLRFILVLTLDKVKLSLRWNLVILAFLDDHFFRCVERISTVDFQNLPRFIY